MATSASAAGRSAQGSYNLAPDRTERVLGVLAIVLLGFVLVALAKGHADWHRLPAVLWVHLATMIATLVLTPLILWHPRGTRRHRVLGYAWVAALGLTALDSFALQLTRPGHFSLIHILSVAVLCLLPALVITARRHDHRRHRRIVRGLTIGALLTAGFFTFPFHRLLGTWLFG